MIRYNTDSALNFAFSISFYAPTQQEADNNAQIIINRFFGNALASLMDLQNVSNVPLAGMDISGANYTYEYNCSIRSGDMDAPLYNVISAESPVEALAALQENAQRQAQINEMPIMVNYLKAV